MKVINSAIALIVLMGALATQAAPHYVRAGATGLGNGNDWTNAFTTLPASLVRGDTYYIAAGTYPPYTFDDPESGTLVTTIKKATLNDHGSQIGWQTAYGAGQAIFNTMITFNRSNYIFDGQVRNESDWFEGSTYGFKIDHNGNPNQNIVIGPNGGPAANNITIKYVYIEAPYHKLPTDQTIRQCAVDTDTYGGPLHTGLVFSHMYVYGSNNVWFLRSTQGAIVQYSASYGAASNSMNHGEIVNLYYSGINAIIRYNQFREAFIGNGGTAIVAITAGGDGLQFYGNVVHHFQVGDASVGFDGYGKGYKSSHNRVYNNTFVDSVGYNAGTAWGGGEDNLVYNNLFVNCPIVSFDSVGPGSANEYNGFSDANRHGESHAQINLNTTIFKNYAARDFTLAHELEKGLPLPSPYNIDLLGTQRGRDGQFDRGAFEYTPGGSVTTPTLLPPTKLRIVVPSL